MARYIDADAAVEEARLAYCKDCNSYNGVKCRACEFDDAMSFIEDYPAADVVPSSEVEELIYKLECLLCHATGNKLSKHTYDLKTMESAVTDYVNDAYWDGHAEAKQEVASEIFAEIEKYMMDFVDVTHTAYKEIGTATFAELKKKYTEDQT